MTDDDGEKEAEDDEKGDSNKKYEVGESFETKPIGDCGERFRKNSDEKKDDW